MSQAPSTEGGSSLLGSLSPSRAADFRACPRLYRYRVVDRLAEPASEAAVRGTLVHAVLETLFDLPPGARTLTEAVRLLPGAWRRLLADDPQAASLADLLPDEDAWLASAYGLLETYFALEDPNRYLPAGRELAVRAEIADRSQESQPLVLRGIVDRLDRAPDGRLRVVDYKTGRAPAEGFEGRALFQLKFYALVLWRLHGVVPAVLRLMYLGDGTIIEHSPDEAELLATERMLLALHEAIRGNYESGVWPAAPGARCSWCPFTAMCPATRLTVDDASPDRVRP